MARIDGLVGHILHIGAGEGRDLPTYLAAEPEVVTLIEPDPGQLPRLLEAAAGHEYVRVIEAAVSADPKAEVLHRFSFGDLNSLRSPTGLFQLFPGLETLARERVARCDPVALVRGLNLEKDRAHVLVIEAPGEALAIVRALDEARLLACFSAVQVQEGQDSLYQRAGTFAEVRALLEAANFNQEPQIDETDPDRPVLSVLFDVEGQRRRVLEVQMTALEEKCEEKSRELAAGTEQIAALTSARETAAEQVKTMTAEHEAAKTRMEALEAKCGEQDSLVKGLRQQITETRQKLSASLNMQRLREADLKDLQRRYGDLLQSREVQDDLLGRLAVSLSNAAHYLQNMDDISAKATPVETTRRRKTTGRKTKAVVDSDE